MRLHFFISAGIANAKLDYLKEEGVRAFSVPEVRGRLVCACPVAGYINHLATGPW